MFAFFFPSYTWGAMTDKITSLFDTPAHDNDRNEPTPLATAGGPIDEISVSLCIYSDDLDPEEVPRTLGVAPTRAHRKGDPIKSRKPGPSPTGTYRSGAWILTLRGEAHQNPEDLTSALLDQLPDDETLWAGLAARYCVQVRYGLHMEAWNRGFGLSPVLVTRIARTHAEMDFDIYAYLDEEG